jgi:hypothetical protein
MFTDKEKMILEQHLKSSLKDMNWCKTREVITVCTGFGKIPTITEFATVKEAQECFDLLTSTYNMQSAFKSEYYATARRNHDLTYTVKIIEMKQYFSAEYYEWFCTTTTCLDSVTYDIDDFISDLTDKNRH